MKAHVWETEEVDGGHLGVEDFWICRQCGASGGPVGFGGSPAFPPFYADGSGLNLTDDCDESREMVARHLGGTS